MSREVGRGFSVVLLEDAQTNACSSIGVTTLEDGYVLTSYYKGEKTELKLTDNQTEALLDCIRFLGERNNADEVPEDSHTDDLVDIISRFEDDEERMGRIHEQP